MSHPKLKRAQRAEDFSPQNFSQEMLEAVRDLAFSGPCSQPTPRPYRPGLLHHQGGALEACLCKHLGLFREVLQ